MLGPLTIWPLFVATCLLALRTPWLGLVGFYFFGVLDPSWNWRWSLPPDFPFQLYIAIFIVCGIAVNGISLEQVRGRLSWPVIGLCTFLAIAFAASINTLSPDLSRLYMSNMWRVVVMACLTILLCDTPDKIRWLMVATVVAQGYNALQINLQYFQDGYSLYVSQNSWANGAKGDSNGYTLYTLPTIAMSIALATFDRTRWVRWGAAAVCLLQIHQVMLLESRGGMLGALLLFAIFVCFVPKTTTNVVLIAAVVSASIALAGPSVVRELGSTFASRNALDSSAASRFELWKAGAAITADYPLLGVGPWAGSLLVPQYYRLDTDRKELHNLLFEISTGVGVPATVAYFSYFWLSWWWSLSHVRRIPLTADDPRLRAGCLAVVCGIPAYMLGSMFSSGSMLETSYILASIGCAIASMVGLRTVPSRPEFEPSDSGAVHPVGYLR